jgi:hypothetical protein
MAGNRSFTDYVASRFYNEFYSAIEEYIGEKPDNLDLKLRKVRNIGNVSLADLEVKWVSVNDLPDMKIEFDVIAESLGRWSGTMQISYRLFNHMPSSIRSN